MPSAIADTTFLVYRMPGHRPTEHPVPLDRTAIWIESSGTTGYSKAIKLGTTATLANIRANVDSLGLTSGDRSLAFLPLSYSYGLVGQLLSHLYAGGSVVFPDDPTLVHRIPRAIADGHVTTMFTVPRLLRMLLSVAGMRPGAVPLKSLRLLTVGGEFVDTTTLRMTMDLLKGVDIAVTYGLAEAGPRVSTLRLPAELSHLGSVGKTIGGVQVKIVDDARREVRPGEIGEIVVTSPSVTQGYVGDVRPDGLVPGHLVYTGDLGYITAAGYIYLLGRKHNCLAIGGRIVYANQLKEILYSCDGIVHADVVVDNLSHPADTARVVLSSQPGKALDLASVRRRCETSLSISLDGVIIEQATRNPAVMFRK
jgi:acyl-coenzyme A synthetase/AMP-(fatty) acid ligase